MVNELLTVAALGSILAGAIFSTVKGYWKAKEGYSFKKLASSLIISAFAATSSINIAAIVAKLPDELSSLGWIGLISSYLIFGFGLDQGLSSLDK